MGLWQLVVAASVAGFLVGRWWVVPAGVPVVVAWLVYDDHHATVHLEGHLEVYVAFMLSLFVCGGLIAGWLTRRTVKALVGRRHSVDP